VEHRRRGGHCFPRVFFLIRRTFVEEFKRLIKKGSGNGQLSPYGSLLGNLEGGGVFIFWDFRETDERGLWKRSVSY